MSNLIQNGKVQRDLIKQEYTKIGSQVFVILLAESKIQIRYFLEGIAYQKQRNQPAEKIFASFYRFILSFMRCFHVTDKFAKGYESQEKQREMYQRVREELVFKVANSVRDWEKYFFTTFKIICRTLQLHYDGSLNSHTIARIEVEAQKAGKIFYTFYIACLPQEENPLQRVLNLFG